METTEIIIPTADIIASAEFHVWNHSVSLQVYPDQGGSLASDDIFALERLAPTGDWIPVVESIGPAMLGASRTAIDIIGTGVYRLNKLLADVAGAEIMQGIASME